MIVEKHGICMTERFAISADGLALVLVALAMPNTLVVAARNKGKAAKSVATQASVEARFLYLIPVKIKG